ncbi:YhjD/YihY/BrkB family envelope integrity protein [Halorubrum sp. 48-1-W]|uniref:YhjD/YihY/BrkB family envelope integrity protein n=1 Tax=Halorubrum sp. 48-1-W TaxID=2249761 RepID=UPI001F543DE0|nr:YhjD/YihY/BrkB family envelope integrity protein [Halorubrum sp. 48-1-W]
MTRHPSSGLARARLVFDTARDQQVTFLAAGVAYYAFVSLVPALLLLLVVATTVFGDALATELLESVSGFLTPAGEEAIGEAVASARGRAGASLLGVVVLLWSTLKVFRGLDTAFVEVYGTEGRVTFLDQLTEAGSVVIGIGAGIAAMLVVGAVAAAVDVPLLASASVLALPVVLTVVFLPMYMLLPDPEIPLREALPGAVFAAVGWTVLQAGFQAYAATAGQYQVYGVVGGILLLVTWLYVAAIVVIVGAVINATLATGSVDGSTAGSAEDPPVGSTPDGSADRQLQHGRGRRTDMNGEADRGGGDGGTKRPPGDGSRGARDDGERPRGAPDVAALEEEVDRLRARLEAFETDVEERTVDKPKLESELKRYVRSRMRRGHARGWGPYLVLLYGTVLTLGAFTFLDGIYAIAAMVVLGLSTLGLYTVFIVVGIGLNLIETPGKALEYARNRGDD